MKKLLFITASIYMLCNAHIMAQITFEHTYTIPNGGEAVFVTDIGNNNYKYVMIDYAIDKFSLYNLNHTPYILNIPIAKSTNAGSTYQIGYITSTLFDCDSTNIEYAIMTDYPNDTTKFMIYRTDGTLIFSRDSVTVQFGYGYNVGNIEIRGIENTPAGAKLFLFNRYNKVSIYGLCGILPQEITEINQSNSYVQEFPNPTSHLINFRVYPPNNYETFELTIFDSAFRPVKITSILGANTQINLDTESLSSGIYFYSLQRENKILQTGKIILVK